MKYHGRRIGVLMGGRSAEREVSLRSGTAMLAAYHRQGLHAVGIDLTEEWTQQISEAAIDVAVIALHGTLGEDGAVQGLLEIMKIPYTGSGITASALCMDKRLTKAVLEKGGVKTPTDIPVNADGPVRFPVFLKPVDEGSSVGLHYLETKAEWEKLGIEDAAGWIAEMPLKGPEVHVSVLNGRALPPVEVVPKSGVYDYESKYTVGATDYYCPARIPAESLKRCMQVAEMAYRLAGCRGAPRIDMILADGGEPAVLEINTIPGMTETSLLPKAAQQAGIDFDRLCLEILEAATTDAAWSHS